MDIRIAKVFWKMFMEHRYMIYGVVFFVALIEILNKAPYINLLILPNNIFIYSVGSIMVLGKLQAERIIYVSIGAFILQLALLLLQRQGVAIQIANGTYFSLVIAVILFIVHYKDYT